jgi:hypothetical protein
MKNLLLILFIAFTYFVIPEQAFGCSTLLRVIPASMSDEELKKLGEEDLKNRFNKADTVFIGEVTAFVDKEERDRYFTEINFKLQITWKGANTKELKVLTPLGCAHFNFKVGKSYLIFAGNNNQTLSELWTTAFDGNMNAEDAADVLEIIGKGENITSK